MPVMHLNGYQCFSPAQLRDEAKRLPELDFNSSDWLGKANSFCHRRGVDPSYGYLLAPSGAITSSGGLRIVFADYSEQVFEKVKIMWSKKTTPAVKESQGIDLVYVVDMRYALAEAFVGKRYNLVKDYEPPESLSEAGKFIYDPKTVKEKDDPETSEDEKGKPYTWSEMFDEVFKLPGDPPPTLDKTTDLTSDSFPKYIPQDLDFRYVTRRDALEMLLQWTGLTLLVSHDGKYKLSPLEDENNDKRDGIFREFKYFLSKDRHKNFFAPGKPAPDKFKFHFRHLTAPNSEVEEYKIVEKKPNTLHISDHLLPIRLPSYYVGDEAGQGVPEDQQSDNVAKDFLKRWEKIFKLFPSKEKTYRGYRYLPSPPPPKFTRGSGPRPRPRPRGPLGDSPSSLRPSGYLESVTWFDTGDGAKTKVVSISERPWLIKPQKLSHPSESVVNVAEGMIYGPVSESQLIFIVDNLHPIIGSLPSGVSEGLSIPFPLPPGKTLEDYKDRFVPVINTLRRSYIHRQRIVIFQEKGDEFWNNTLAISEGQEPIRRFELIEDKTLQMISAMGNLLNDDDTWIQGLDGLPISVRLADPWLRFRGYRSYEDPLYGDQVGYRGHARPLGITDFSGNPMYEIIEMEHEARYVEAIIVDEETGDDGSGNGGSGF